MKAEIISFPGGDTGESTRIPALPLVYTGKRRVPSGDKGLSCNSTSLIIPLAQPVLTAVPSAPTTSKVVTDSLEITIFINSLVISTAFPLLGVIWSIYLLPGSERTTMCSSLVYDRIEFTRTSVLSFLPSNAKHFNPLEPIVSVANSLPNLENCLSTLLAVSLVEES